MRGLYQRGIGFAPFARGQAVEPVGADCHAHQTQGRVTDGRGHAPHLAVAALGEDEFDPGGRNVLAEADRWHRAATVSGSGMRRTSAGRVRPSSSRTPSTQCFQRLCVRYALDLRPVGLGKLVFWLGDAGLQGAVVGEQQQALAVVVEPTGGAHVRHRNELGQRAPAFLVGELAQDIERFVEAAISITAVRCRRARTAAHSSTGCAVVRCRCC